MHSILLIDDEFDSRCALGLLLELHGFEVTAAASGEEALELLRSRRFDLILTDWMMPFMSGQELISRLRAEKIAEGAPVLVLTAAAEAVATLKPACAGIIAKPFDIGMLLSTI
jgi:two-component system, OmpR family, response regulator VicR